MTGSHELFEQRVESMQDDINEIRNSMKQIAEAITRLTILEERHANISNALDKMMAKVEKLEEHQKNCSFTNDLVIRIFDKIEKAQETADGANTEIAKLNSSANSARVILSAVWTVVGGSIVYVLGKVLP